MFPVSKRWTGQSRLSDVLKAHPDALRRLSSIGPGLSILHGDGADMAGLIRLEDLARMAERPLEAIIAAITGETAPASPSAPFAWTCAR
jgi:hypothetical protein